MDSLELLLFLKDSLEPLLVVVLVVLVLQLLG